MEDTSQEPSIDDIGLILGRVSRHMSALAYTLDEAENLISNVMGQSGKIGSSLSMGIQRLDYIQQSITDLSELMQVLSTNLNVEEIDSSKLKMQSTKFLLSGPDQTGQKSHGDVELF